MTNNDQQWLTAGEVARILHLSERQASRYGQMGKIRTKRAGRRVLYLAADVTTLADELRVDIRPAPAQRGAMLPPDLVRYLQEQEDRMRQQGETQHSIDRRLEQIERRMREPAQITITRNMLLALIGLAVLVALIIAVVVSVVLVVTR